MDYRQELIEMGIEMEKKSAFLHKTMHSMPSGTLQVVKEANRIKYNQLVYSDGKLHRYGIKKKPELVRKLAKKAFLKEYTERLDSNISLLADVINDFSLMNESIILGSLPDNYSLLPKEYFGNWLPSSMHPVFNDAIPAKKADLYIPEEEVETWAIKPYRANTININSMRYRTIDGIRMRSKSEVAILDIYKKHGIPVHYDELLVFNNSLLSPDFVAARYDGKIIIHEHFGLVNNEDYMKSNFEKLKKYKECGFVPWDNLIITYDTLDGGIDLKLIESEILSKLKA